jgi:hypothetical protein
MRGSDAWEKFAGMQRFYHVFFKPPKETAASSLTHTIYTHKKSVFMGPFL